MYCHISFFFHNKNDNSKLWVEVIIFTSLDAVATVDVLTANNNDVNLVETRNETIKSSSCVDSINKFDRHFLRWQLFLPPEGPRDIAFFPSVL